MLWINLLQPPWKYFAFIQDTLCDVWWFPGTSDPNKPCYGYWNAKDERNTPVRFFGLSLLGSTILDYYDFMPGMTPPGNVSTHVEQEVFFMTLCLNVYRYQLKSSQCWLWPGVQAITAESGTRCQDKKGSALASKSLAFMRVRTWTVLNY